MDSAVLQSSFGNAVSAARTGGKEKARQAAEEFEAVFLAQILNSMTAGIETDGPFGGGQGEEMWRSMLNEEYAAAIARQGGIGVADQVYREIMKMQDISYTEGGTDHE